MKIWRVIVFETIVHRVRYEVEADTLDEAKDKAAIGDTYEELDLSSAEVVNREVEGDPFLLT